MKCFEHHDSEAVGVCKVCGKGLCPKCSVDLGYALSCAGRCEEEARQIQLQTKQARNVLNAGRTNRYLAPMLFAFMGAVFLMPDVYQFGPRLSFPSVFGAGILVFAFYMLFASRQLGQTEKNRNDDQ